MSTVGYDMRLEIVVAVLELGVLLLRKNAGYGNSAADPLAVFSKLGAVERLGVRMDDKLSRIARGREDGQEDTRGDLAGYLVLDGIVRGMRDGAEPVVFGDVEGLWGEVMGLVGKGEGEVICDQGSVVSEEEEGEEEDSRRGAEAQREDGEELEGMSKEDREDWEAKAGQEEDSRRGAEAQRGEGMEEMAKCGGLEVVMGDGEVCVRVPVGLWERTLEEAGAAEVLHEEVEELRALYLAAREHGARLEGVEHALGAELHSERMRSWELAEELDLARRCRRLAVEQRDEVRRDLEEVRRSRDVLREGFVELQEEGKRLEAHGARLREELNALVRAHEEGEEDSRRGAEAQRLAAGLGEGDGEEVCHGEAGARRGTKGGMEQVGPVVNVWSLLDDAQVYQRRLEEELEGERLRSWGLAEELLEAREHGGVLQEQLNGLVRAGVGRKGVDTRVLLWNVRWRADGFREYRDCDGVWQLCRREGSYLGVGSWWPAPGDGVAWDGVKRRNVVDCVFREGVWTYRVWGGAGVYSWHVCRRAGWNDGKRQLRSDR